MVYIFWTCRDAKEAETIVQELLEERLIACASIFPSVVSLFRWEGRVEKQEEVKVLLKSRQELFEKISDYISVRSSYDLPEISMVEAKAFQPYLEWIKKETIQ